MREGLTVWHRWQCQACAYAFTFPEGQHPYNCPKCGGQVGRGNDEIRACAGPRSLAHLYNALIPQSLQFAIDMLPAIRWALAQVKPVYPSAELLDVGTGAGAGANLWALLYRSDFLGTPLYVDALDIEDDYLLHARNAYPALRRVIHGRLEQDVRTWDIVTCSHVLEHLTDPGALIEACRAHARAYAIFYCPLDEDPPLPYHLSVISKAYIDQFEPGFYQEIESPGWQRGKCALFCLTGMPGWK